MQQSKKMSLVEVLVGLLLGLISSIFIFQPLIFSYYHIVLPVSSNTIIAVWFTLISLIRSYLTRRFFVYMHKRAERKKEI